MFNVPDFAKMDETRRAMETERALRELANEIERTIQDIDRKFARIKKVIEELSENG